MQPFGTAQTQTGNSGIQTQAAPFNTQKFIENNRIHVEHGSLISPSDPLLPIHPGELTQENEGKLRSKIQRAYTIEGYSFFDQDQRAAISAALGAMVPLSASTKEAVLGKGITDWIKQLQSGQDPAGTKETEKNARPFKAVIEHYLNTPEKNAASNEFSKNAVGMYLVMEEALHERGFTGSLAHFTHGVSNGEGLVAKLSSYLGYETRQFMDTARTQGIDGVGKLLGVEDDFLRDVKKLNNYLEDHKFSVNAVMNWKIGRTLPGMKNAGIAEKIEAGTQARVNAKIMSSRMAAGHRYEVPDPIKQTERTIAGMLNFLPPELAETLYLLGTEIAYTPERDLKPIAPDIPAYGFHRRITQHPDDVKGIYQIFVSGKHDAEEAVRVLVHEAHHLLIPGQFREGEIKMLDDLASHDMLRLKALKELMDGWMAGDDATKAKVVQTLNRPEFSIGGKSFSDCIGQAEMLTFYHQVQHAHDRLQIDSEFYHKSGYASPESRFQEVNSRYAELRYVREREHPDMLAFIVPGITVAYEQMYLPHVREQLQDLRARAAQEESQPAPQPMQSAASATASPTAESLDGLGFASHGVGARTTIDSSSAQLTGMLYNREQRNTII